MNSNEMQYTFKLAGRRKLIHIDSCMHVPQGVLKAMVLDLVHDCCLREDGITLHVQSHTCFEY